MLYKFKGMKEYENIERSALLEFLKMNTTKNGHLTVPLDVIRSGTLFAGKKTENTTDEWIPWVFSSYDNDRFNERVDPEGWELAGYKENPVVLWAHNHDIPAIGFAEGVIKGETLSGKIKFNAKDYDPFGWSIGERVKNGVIRAGSVGFRILEIEFVEHTKNPEEKCDLIFRKQELLEFSICNVPANPFALRKDSSEDNDDVGNGNTAPTGILSKYGFMPFVKQKTDGGMYGRRDASIS